MKWHKIDHFKTGKKVLEVEIASGVNKGKNCFDTQDYNSSIRYRASIYTEEMSVPNTPMLCNINKQAQGQTLDFVGLYLPDDVFTHGQLLCCIQ